MRRACNASAKTRGRIREAEARLGKTKKIPARPEIEPKGTSILGDEVSKRGGSKPGAKSSKELSVDKEIVVTIEKDELPEGAQLHGYEAYYVQELIVKKEVVLYKRARYTLPNGQSMLAPLPVDVNGNFGPNLKNFVIQQYHVCNVPENKIQTLLEDIGLSISEGSIHTILMEAAGKFAPEIEKVRTEGLKAKQLQVDDTGARFRKENWFTSVLQNELFAYFKTTPTKSRKNFLLVLQGPKQYYALNEATIAYLKGMKVRPVLVTKLEVQAEQVFGTSEEWTAFLESINVTKYNTGKATLLSLEEGALVGGLLHAGINLAAVLMSDNAPQFKSIFLYHALCWIHMIRAIKKIVPCNMNEAAEIEKLLGQIWDLYRALKTYRESNDRTPERADDLTKLFDTTVGQLVESQALGIELANFKKYRKELLLSLTYPDTPLHNNSSEQDIRAAVVKRKISGPTRSEQGRIARDAGLSFVKTCRKLKLSPWYYIGDFLSPTPAQPPLHEIIRQLRDARQTSPPSPPS